ncbi:AI-2E family transporter [Acuticoccus mangrovi]|uniref:AI-2E family transporter n=1 Tax=Acuticoccus mangrovi TaxID=2796142 RepID=A0A934MI96_9HYPH|nr:AI-2E family transporter [Acuticoccus mangrovi]MBJ3776951.1 AI-2E family transporter [Acuticoccus mangrovi]
MDHDISEASSGRTVEQRAVDVVIRLGVLAVLIYLAVSLIHPFLSILVWSAILTVTLYPIYRWGKRMLFGSGALSALVVTLVSLALVFGPLAMLCASFVQSLEALAAAIHGNTLTLPKLPAGIAGIPVIGDDIVHFWDLASSDLSGFMREYGQMLVVPGEWMLGIIASLAGVIAVVALAVVISAFLYAPGPRLVEGTRSLILPVAGSNGIHFLDLAGATIRNVARGVVGVSVLEALVIGVVFLAAEVPHVGILTLAALVVSVAQIGSGVVVVPVAIWAWFALDPLTAAFLSVAALPIFMIQPVLRPIIMGQRSETPVLVIFLGLFGGVIAYGLPGLFIGPVVLAVLFDLVHEWIRARSAADAEAPPVPVRAADSP